MALAPWTYDPSRDWPVKTNRKWLWTMFAEPGNHNKVVATSVATGMTDVVILVNDSPVAQPKFGVKFCVDNTKALCDKLRDAKITPHLGTWLDPKAQYVDDCAQGMADLAGQCNAASICLDLEGEWNKRISNHTAFVADTVRPAFKGFPVPIGVTSFAFLPAAVVPALSWCVEYHDGYGQPQAYSVYQGKSWQMDKRLTPDVLPRAAWDSWSPVTRRLCCLLAAWGSEVPGRTIAQGQWQGKAWGIAESIEVSAAAADLAGFPELGWWSEEGLSRRSASAGIRRETLAEIEATGKPMVGGSNTLRNIAIGGAAAAGAYAAYKFFKG